MSQAPRCPLYLRKYRLLEKVRYLHPSCSDTVALYTLYRRQVIVSETLITYLMLNVSLFGAIEIYHTSRAQVFLEVHSSKSQLRLGTAELLHR